MARIDGKSDAETGPLTRAVFRAARSRAMGRVPEPLRIMAHSPATMWSAGAFELGIARARSLPPALKALAELKVASLLGCAFCIDIGSALGRGKGVGEPQLRDLARHRESAAFDELERLVLDYAVALTRTPVDADDALVERLRESLSQEQLVELTAVIAWENFRARFNSALDVPVQGFSEGAACPLPRTGEAAEPVRLAR